MGDEGKNVVMFGKLQESKAKYVGEHTDKYLVYVTRTRQKGYCRLWIIQMQRKHLEYFDLQFNQEGLVDYRSVYGKKNIMTMLGEEKRQRISYGEAIMLLGDAIRQNYKYERHLELVEQIRSLHVERSWQQEWRDKERGDLMGINHLPLLSMIRLYLQSIEQEDSSLCYDLLTEEMRGENRELYLHTWTHPLAGYDVEDVEIASIDGHVLQEEVEVWLLAIVIRPDGKKLETDIGLCCRYTEDGYRIQEERIGEVREFCRKK